MYGRIYHGEPLAVVIAFIVLLIAFVLFVYFEYESLKDKELEDYKKKMEEDKDE